MTDLQSGIGGVSFPASRVSPVSRVERTPPSHEAELDRLNRISDLSNLQLPAPVVESIPAPDIEKFRGLVYESSAGGGSGRQWMNPVVPAVESMTMSSVPVGALLTPADRIAATLTHIRTLRGL